jgi:hypothetical protein
MNSRKWVYNQTHFTLWLQAEQNNDKIFHLRVRNRRSQKYILWDCGVIFCVHRELLWNEWMGWLWLRSHGIPTVPSQWSRTQNEIHSKTHLDLRVMRQLYLSDFNRNWIMLTGFSKISQYKLPWKSIPLEPSRFTLTERQMDKHDESNRCFSQFLRTRLKGMNKLTVNYGLHMHFYKTFFSQENS